MTKSDEVVINRLCHQLYAGCQFQNSWPKLWFPFFDESFQLQLLVKDFDEGLKISRDEPNDTRHLIKRRQKKKRKKSFKSNISSHFSVLLCYSDYFKFVGIDCSIFPQGHSGRKRNIKIEANLVLTFFLSTLIYSMKFTFD